MRTMTTKQAALLAAVGTTLRLFMILIPSFAWLLAPGVWRERELCSVRAAHLSFDHHFQAALPGFSFAPA